MSRCWMFLALGCCLAITGCGSSEYNDYSDAPKSDSSASGHSHAEGHAGAHGGEVIEFDAAHAHHAELVFDEQTRDLTLYFYGAEIGEAQPAEDLDFHLEGDGEEIHVDCTASPLDGETDETASRFVVAGSTLPEEVTSLHDLEGHFHVTMDGQDFVGSFGHHHHDHDEDHEEHGDHDDHGDHDEDGEDHSDDHDDEADHDHDEDGHDEDHDDDHGDGEEKDAEAKEEAAE